MFEPVLEVMSRSAHAGGMIRIRTNGGATAATRLAAFELGCQPHVYFISEVTHLTRADQPVVCDYTFTRSLDRPPVTDGLEKLSGSPGTGVARQ